MSLTKEQRDALPESDFAVPEKRALPMHDETHCRMAWNMVDRTKGLTPEEKAAARKRILHRAQELGISTDDWHMQAMRFDAMAITMPAVKDHPNRIPFKGILTRVDEPSDNPLGGSNGKCVILPKAVAEQALPSLLGMAVDFTPDLSGHDARRKIGLITEATIDGNAINIAGYFYGADFTEEVKRIQAEKASLGFSYEAQAQIQSLDDDPLVIKSCIFTGAAVLYKDKAAYTTTALAAQAENSTENSTMDEKVMQLIENLQKEVANLKQTQANDMEQSKVAAGSIHHMVKPHADKLRASADAMSAAGMGMDAKRGHVAVLHHMADQMEADAAMGRMPHIYYTNDYYMHAGANKAEGGAINAIAEKLDVLTTKLTDIEKAKFEASTPPERKTLDPSVKALLAKAGVNPGSDKINVEALDKALDQASISRQNRIAVKFALTQNNMLDTQAVV